MSETAIVFGVGASDGLGAALCRRFANEGMHVIAAGRTEERLDKVAASATGRVQPCVTDVTQSSEVAAGGGTIVFTGATASIRARPPFTAFASGKAALRAVAQGMAREFGPQGLHVGHVLIDGIIDGDVVNSRFPALKEKRGEAGMLDLDAIADAYWSLHRQPRRAWTHELDLRPHSESF